MLRRILVVLATSLLLSTIAAPAPAAVWRTTGTSWQNPDARHPLVVDLRYATHANFDRVVIDIQGHLPGYRIRYRSHFQYDGSGDQVPIGAGIGLVLHPAYAHGRHGHSVYDGPHLVHPGFPALNAIAFTGDYEGYVSFAFALNGHRPYRVFRLHDPQRIVIDFKHPS